MNHPTPYSGRAPTRGDHSVFRASIFGAAMAIGLALPAFATTTYRLDDGAASNNLGPSFAGEFMWGNVFDAVAGAETISTISVAFGTIAAPEQRPVRVYLYQMVTANDPRGAVLIATATGMSGLPKTNTFLDFAIPPTTVHGQFFAAISMQVYGNATVVPARYDKDATANSYRAWYFGADSYLGMPLSAAPFAGSMNNYIIPGVFMLRATGIPAPGGAALLLLGGGLLANQRKRHA